jgi:hypothetical protein
MSVRTSAKHRAYPGAGVPQASRTSGDCDRVPPALAVLLVAALALTVVDIGRMAATVTVVTPRRILRMEACLI